MQICSLVIKTEHSYNVLFKGNSKYFSKFAIYIGFFKALDLNKQNLACRNTFYSFSSTVLSTSVPQVRYTSTQQHAIIFQV